MNDLRSGALVRAVVADAVELVVTSQRAALADEPDAVHQHRTAVRRLRDVLDSFERDLADDRMPRVTAAAKAWGATLGVVRDAEVRAQLAAEALRRHGFAADPAWTRLVDTAVAEREHAMRLLRDEAASAGSTERDRMLQAFAAGPDVRKPDRAARARIRSVLRREAKRIRRAHRRLDGSIDRLHDLRKAGRRLRHVAEAIRSAAQDILADEVAALAHAGRRLHKLLGEHRDLVTFADRIARERASAAAEGAPLDAYDVLEPEARTAAAAMRKKVDRAVRRIRDAGRQLD